MESWLSSFAQANFERSVDTAHDLKTPLNVAVLNLELLRMRLAKLGAVQSDEKIVAYTKAIENELRRMARIFDTFFVLSTPPREEPEPMPVDLCALCDETLGLKLEGPLFVVGHATRIRQALKMFAEGTANVFMPESRKTWSARDGKWLRISTAGTPQIADFEVTKVFKFYYTDPLGNADLSLAAARLIAETYGGELIAMERDNVVEFRLSIPLGA